MSTDSTACGAETSCASTRCNRAALRCSSGSSMSLAPRRKKNGGERKLSPVALRGSDFEPTSLEHDAEGNRHELHRAGVGRIAVVASFDERLEDRQRQVDASAGVP